jgi:CRISPR type III-B/RAMP module-associated protein Cmr3
MWYEIIPNDTLFFRDGRPFSMGTETWATSIFPPYPSTVYGAIRSWLIFEKGGLKEFDEGKFKEELGKGLAVVGIESVIKNAIMYNIRKLIVSLNYSHKGYICYDNGIFYHEELEFECSDIEITDDISI